MKQIEFKMQLQGQEVTVKGRVYPRPIEDESDFGWQLHDYTITDAEGKSLSAASGEEGDLIAQKAAEHAEAELADVESRN